MKPLRRTLETIAGRIFALLTEIFPGGRAPNPDPAKPLGAIWYYAKESACGQRLFIFLPGRRDRATDFARHSFITMAQRTVPDLDCVAVDATIGYYLDGSVADRIQREIVIPARAHKYREIWLVGVSMGGLGAFFHERTFPGETDGLILLAPFLGDDNKLFTDIDAAGGAVLWASAQLSGNVERNRATYQRDLWLFLGRLPFRRASQQEIWVAYGDRDRLLPGIERLSTLLPPKRIFRLPGGHTWDVWKTGFDEILKRITW